MADTLEDLEKSFGGGQATAAEAPSGLEELERSFAPRSGASQIPGQGLNLPAPVEKAKLPEFEPGFAGGVDKALTQIGAGMADLGMGYRQLTGSATPEDVVEKRRIDEGLIGDSTMGKVNYLGGKTAPFAAIPAVGGGSSWVAPVTYNAVVGGLQGLLEPVGPGESRGLNVGAGALGAAAAPAILQLIGAAVKPAADATGALARKALDMGIPLGTGDITASRFTKAVKSLLDDLPITGGMGKAHADDVNNAITRAASKTVGLDTPVLDLPTLAAQKKVLGSGFDKVWKGTNIELDANLFGALQSLPDKLNKLTPTQAGQIDAFAQDIMKKVVADPQTGKLVIPGEYVNSLQSQLGKLSASGEGLQKGVAGELRKELLDALERSTSGATRQTLNQLNSQWKAMKMLMPLATSAEAGVAGREAGQIPAALLSNAAKVHYGENLHTSPFADLAPIAGRFAVDRTPRTGGSMRALVQNLAGPAAIGTGGYMLGAGIPASQVLGGGALLASAGPLAQATLNSPRIARAVLSEPVKQSLLSVPALRPALRGVAGTALSRGAATGALGLAAIPSRAAQPSSLEEE